MKEEQRCYCRNKQGDKMREIGSWETAEQYEDYDAEFSTLYQCTWCKDIKLV